MIDLAEYRKRSSSLADYLPWAALVAPGVVLNKDGSFQRTARFRGPDLDSATPAELVGTTARLNSALRRLGSGWAIFVEAVRLAAQHYPEGLFPDSASALAFCALVLASGFAAALIWQSTRGTIVPWVVQVDKLGEAQVVASAVADYRPTDPQIAWHLARFIEQVRSISDDPVIVRQNWLRAYDYTTDRGAVSLNDYARSNDPFAKVSKIQIAVEVSSVIRASPDSFRVAWVERRYENGSLASTERWTAILTIVTQQPRDADRLKANPLGVYVNAINWSKELS